MRQITLFVLVTATLLLIACVPKQKDIVPTPQPSPEPVQKPSIEIVITTDKTVYSVGENITVRASGLKGVLKSHRTPWRLEKFENGNWKLYQVSEACIETAGFYPNVCLNISSDSDEITFGIRTDYRDSYSTFCNYKDPFPQGKYRAVYAYAIACPDGYYDNETTVKKEAYSEFEIR